MDADHSSPSEDVRQSREMSIRVPRTRVGTELPDDSTQEKEEEDEEEEQLSPTSRLMEGIYIVVMIGFGTPLNLPLFRAGFEAQLRHYPRFRNIQTHDSMVECGKSNDATWGNKLGYIILPFRIAMHDDQIAYIREAKKMAERKRRSLEVIMTQKMTEIFLKCFGVKVYFMNCTNFEHVYISSLPCFYLHCIYPSKQATSFIVHRMLGNTTLLFSNMIGPVERIDLWGHTVTFIAPSVYGPGEGLILNYQSYSSTIKVVLSFDEEKLPDHRHLLDDFVESLRLIKDAASKLTESSKHESLYKSWMSAPQDTRTHVCDQYHCVYHVIDTSIPMWCMYLVLEYLSPEID